VCDEADRFAPLRAKPEQATTCAHLVSKSNNAECYPPIHILPSQVLSFLKLVMKKIRTRFSFYPMRATWPRGSAVVQALCYKPGGRGFQTR
jgi:hypothetical protein